MTKPVATAYMAKSSAIQATVFLEATTERIDHKKLTQKKAPSKFTPYNINNSHTWEEMIERTMQANDLVNSNAIHSKRQQNENLKKTKRMLEPDLQEEVNVLGNKITGCAKK
tara:strand:+ start:244 stop:579 length:336 start_codon:yes stop_codon:yes gene_type:complete